METEEETATVNNKRRKTGEATARKAPSDLHEEALTVGPETATTPPNKRVKRNL